MIYFKLLKDLLKYGSDKTVSKLKQYYKPILTEFEYNRLIQVESESNSVKATYYLYVLQLLTKKQGINIPFLLDLIKSEDTVDMLKLYKTELEKHFETVVLPVKTETKVQKPSAKVETKVEDLDDLF